MNQNANVKIPMWINILQGVLILIMLQQAYMFFFAHDSVAASGITVDGSTPNQNLLFEFAARTATMALVSIIVLISQNPRYLLVVLLMNVFREGFETIIDPLFPLSNAPMPPIGDLVVHLIIVAIEIWAFITLLKIVKRMDNGTTST